MITIKPSSSSIKYGPGFLSTATSNYVSSRLLFLNNQLYDGGIMAHEAVEKIMKACLYLKEPNRQKVKGHDLEDLKSRVETKLEMVLSQYDKLFEYYEACYSYRYPDNPKPKNFSTGTNYVKLLDNVFMPLHNQCLDMITDDIIKYKSGVYEHCVDFFQDKDTSPQMNILLERNHELDKSKIQTAKTFWHDKGFYLKDDNGVTLFPGGMATKEH